MDSVDSYIPDPSPLTPVTPSIPSTPVATPINSANPLTQTKNQSISNTTSSVQYSISLIR